MIPPHRKLGFSALWVGALCTIGLAGPVGAETDQVIRSILGRTMTNNQVSQATIYADGSLEGVFNGISFAGTWTLDGGKYCREFTRGLTAAPVCMTAAAVRSPDGTIVGVVFEGAGGQSRFELLN